MSWACLQLGSREHYAIPAALNAAGALDVLITDSWLDAGMSRLIRPVLPSLAGRRRGDIPDSLVRHRTMGRILLDLDLRFRSPGVWPAAIRRNHWFGQWAAEEIPRSAAGTVFSYSYTARRPFLEAGRRGMRRILDQIDGAWREEQVWRELSSPYHFLEAEIDRAPQEYWKMWREELELADVIVVNSEWSKALIVEAGAAAEKIAVVPLVYQQPESSERRHQSSECDSLVTRHSSRVTGSRPRLKALFLGNVVLRKGVGQLFEAILKLSGEPVDFIFAGPVGVKIPGEISALPQVSFLGPVDRKAASLLYRDADFFLFPTLSDGFGLTQLEALGHGLPVIASTHCGRVVEDRANGLILEGITAESIAEAVMTLVRDREFLPVCKAGHKCPTDSTRVILHRHCSPLRGSLIAYPRVIHEIRSFRPLPKRQGPRLSGLPENVRPGCDS